MSNQVDSISRRLDRCDGILKELIDQPSYKRVKPPKSQQKGDNKISITTNISRKKFPGKKNSKTFVRKMANHSAPEKKLRKHKYSTPTPDGRLLSSTPIKKDKIIEVLNINSSEESIIRLLQSIRHNSVSTNGDLSSNIDEDDGDDENSTLVEESKQFGDVKKFLSDNLKQTPKRKSAENSLDNKNSVIDQWGQILKPVKQKSEPKTAEVSEGNNLEVSVVKHQNSILRSEVEKMSKSLEMVLEQQNKLLVENMALKKELTSLRKELSIKTMELESDKHAFQLETKTIKREVNGALGKLKKVKKDLMESEKEKEGISSDCKEKENEIERLNILNKHLRSSVTRLLQDLESSNLNQKHVERNRMLLHDLDDASIKLPPPSKEGTSVDGISPEMGHTIRTIYRNNDVIKSHPVATSEFAGSNNIGKLIVTDYDIISCSEDDESFRPLAMMSSLSCSTSDDLSITSSTLVAERNFSEELITLDENIAKLQENLRNFQNDI